MNSLDDAITIARAAWNEVTGLMTAADVSFAELPYLPTWPPGIAAAYKRWAYAMNDVGRILAHQDGAEPETPLSDADRARLTVRAFELVVPS